MKTSTILYSLCVLLAVLVGRNHVASQETATEAAPETEEPVQSGPLIDLLGPKLQSLDIDEAAQSATVKEHYTNEILAGKKVIGLYFSADWYVLTTLCSFCFAVVRRWKSDASQPFFLNFLILQQVWTLPAIHS